MPNIYIFTGVGLTGYYVFPVYEEMYSISPSHPQGSTLGTKHIITFKKLSAWLETDFQK